MSDVETRLRGLLAERAAEPDADPLRYERVRGRIAARRRARVAGVAATAVLAVGGVALVPSLLDGLRREAGVTAPRDGWLPWGVRGDEPSSPANLRRARKAWSEYRKDNAQAPYDEVRMLWSGRLSRSGSPARMVVLEGRRPDGSGELAFVYSTTADERPAEFAGQVPAPAPDAGARAVGLAVAWPGPTKSYPTDEVTADIFVLTAPGVPELRLVGSTGVNPVPLTDGLATGTMTVPRAGVVARVSPDERWSDVTLPVVAERYQLGTGVDVDEDRTWPTRRQVEPTAAERSAGDAAMAAALDRYDSDADWTNRRHEQIWTSRLPAGALVRIDRVTVPEPLGPDTRLVVMAVDSQVGFVRSDWGEDVLVTTAADRDGRRYAVVVTAPHIEAVTFTPDGTSRPAHAANVDRGWTWFAVTGEPAGRLTLRTSDGRTFERLLREGSADVGVIYGGMATPTLSPTTGGGG